MAPELLRRKAGQGAQRIHCRTDSLRFSQEDAEEDEEGNWSPFGRLRFSSGFSTYLRRKEGCTTHHYQGPEDSASVQNRDHAQSSASAQCILGDFGQGN